MAKCFLTGVELPLEETWVLDIPAAHRALRDLRQRVAAVERLIQQLSPREDVEIYDAKKRETFTRKDRRLINPSIAKALSAVYPEKDLFMPWAEWRSRRPLVEGTGGSTNEDGAAGQGEGVNGETYELKPQ